MRLEHRQIDIRQNPSMLELIQVHVDCGADHGSGPSVPLPNSTSRGATRANNNGNVARGFCALWRTELVAAESVSSTLRWMPFATLVRHVDPHTRQYPTTAALLL